MQLISCLCFKTNFAVCVCEWVCVRISNGSQLLRCIYIFKYKCWLSVCVCAFDWNERPPCNVGQNVCEVVLGRELDSYGCTKLRQLFHVVECMQWQQLLPQWPSQQSSDEFTKAESRPPEILIFEIGQTGNIPDFDWWPVLSWWPSDVTLASNNMYMFGVKSLLELAYSVLILQSVNCTVYHLVGLVALTLHLICVSWWGNMTINSRNCSSL